jgi:PAS domain S-box-containing protein
VFEKIPKTIGEIFGVNPGELARWSDSAALSSFLGHDHSDAALRRKLEQERLESDERFRLTIECLPTAVIVANREGNMFLLNSRTTEMFDYQREEMLGQRIEMLLPHILRKCRDEKDTEVLVHPGYQTVNTDQELTECGKTAMNSWSRSHSHPFKSMVTSWFLAP